MDAKLTEIISRMKQQRGPSYVTVQLSDMAELMALVAEQQAKSADKLERFTRWLVYLTFALFLLTAFLCYDAYSHRQSENLTHQSTTK
jgi:hypothetical protein